MPVVLVIERDDLLRDALAHALMNGGYAVLQARHREEGLRLFRAVSADVLLTQLDMPEKDAVVLLRELRRALPRPGIIVVSGDLDDEPPRYFKIAQRLGAIHALQTPFDAPTLRRAVETVLAERRRLDAFASRSSSLPARKPVSCQ
jgi:DNA-binding NarL/FixJ family response regulator